MVACIKLFCVFYVVHISAIKGVILSNSSKEIVVAFSQRPPFVFQNSAGALNGLDILLVENFAKKTNLQIKYIEYKTPLNEVFIKEKTFNTLTHMMLK